MCTILEALAAVVMMASVTQQVRGYDDQSSWSSDRYAVPRYYDFLLGGNKRAVGGGADRGYADFVLGAKRAAMPHGYTYHYSPKRPVSFNDWVMGMKRSQLEPGATGDAAPAAASKYQGVPSYYYGPIRTRRAAPDANIDPMAFMMGKKNNPDHAQFILGGMKKKTAHPASVNELDDDDELDALAKRQHQDFGEFFVGGKRNPDYSSFVMGKRADDYGAFVMGKRHPAADYQSFVIGHKRDPNYGSFVVGKRQPLGYDDFVLGQKRQPQSYDDFVLGQKRKAQSYDDFVLGQKRQDHDIGSFVMGKRDPAGFADFVVGKRSKGDMTSHVESHDDTAASADKS